MNEPDSRKRGTGPNALRRGRFSQPGGDYFVTICVEPRIPVLIAASAREVLAEVGRIAADGHWHLRCATVMPDHVHLFFTLGEGLSLSRTVARLKAKTRSGLLMVGVDWQENFYDHRLREGDRVEHVIRYIHLNPHRRGLIRESERWQFFFCDPGDWEWYEQTTHDGSPIPEWLK